MTEILLKGRKIASHPSAFQVRLHAVGDWLLSGDGFFSVIGRPTNWDNGCSSKAARVSTLIQTQTKCGLRVFLGGCYIMEYSSE